MNGRFCPSFFKYHISFFFFFRFLQVELEFIYIQVGPAAFNGGVKQRGMSQAKLTHPESGCYFSLIFPELPFLGSLNALISCLLATRAEHMVCLKVLVKRVRINLTVGSAKEKQESSQTFTSSPKQTHSPLKTRAIFNIRKVKPKETPDISPPVILGHSPIRLFHHQFCYPDLISFPQRKQI